MIFSKLCITHKNDPQEIIHRLVHIETHDDMVYAYSMNMYTLEKDVVVACISIDQEIEGLFWKIHEKYLEFNGRSINPSTNEEMDEVIWRLYV